MSPNTVRAITFTTPSQADTVGGVYVIQELARALARDLRVSLLVREPPTRPVDGVIVKLTRELSSATVPAADVLVGGIAQGGVTELSGLPPTCGEQVFLFQGYGAPRNRLVREALRRRPRVLAVSSWLADDARAHGCPTAQFVCGIDREVFFPGPPAEQRRPVVAMLASTVDWKGTGDGMEALLRVRARRPDAELRLFGNRRPEGFPASFAASPSRAEVGALFRDSAVVVCSSWEEGLGLPGLEALACGAGLATTDTKGSRDYAHHQRTALVSPPRDPDALAENVLLLLGDRGLRGRLARAGTALAFDRHPSWPQAAERFMAAVEQLLPS